MKRFLLLWACSAFASNAALADNWMQNISDDALFCRLSIPGSHDSGTGNGFTSSLAAGVAQTQDKNIGEQWECGIRAFDLRPALSKGTLTIFHGSAQTRVSFDEALATICEKLEANPSECAVVIMQNEGGGDDNEWGRHVTASLDKVSSYLVNYRSDLKMAEMRGKLLVLNRNLYRPIPYGGVCQGWGNNAANNQGTIEAPNGTKGTFHVQDFYEVTGSGAGDLKKQYVAAMLDESDKAKNRHIYINHASGYTSRGSIFGVPTVTSIRDNAANVNTYLLSLLADGQCSTCCTGLVMMDFAGVDTSGSTTVNGAKLVEAIIATNSFSENIVQVESAAVCTAAVPVHDASGRLVTGSRGASIVIEEGRKKVR